MCAGQTFSHSRINLFLNCLLISNNISFTVGKSTSLSQNQNLKEGQHLEQAELNDCNQISITEIEKYHRPLPGTLKPNPSIEMALRIPEKPQQLPKKYFKKMEEIVTNDDLKELDQIDISSLVKESKGPKTDYFDVAKKIKGASHFQNVNIDSAAMDIGRGKCIIYRNQWYTPSEFQHLCRTEKEIETNKGRN